MTSEEPTPNIFEQAAKGLEKSRTPSPSDTKKQTSHYELDSLFEKILKSRDEVEKKLDKLYEESGMTPQEISLFLSNPDNLSHTQRVYHEKKGHLLRNLLHHQKGNKETPFVDQKKRTLERGNSRKGKTLGPRRGWMSM